MSALIDRVKSIKHGAEVLFEWLGSGGVATDKSEAQRRANICLKCPQNCKGSTLIDSVASAVKKHVEVKNKLGLRVQSEKGLGQCRVCSCSLKLKVWVPKSILKSHMLDGEAEAFKVANSKCWMVE